jgi:hypothetical protein
VIVKFKYQLKDLCCMQGPTLNDTILFLYPNRTIVSAVLKLATSTACRIMSLNDTASTLSLVTACRRMFRLLIISKTTILPLKIGEAKLITARAPK